MQNVKCIAFQVDIGTFCTGIPVLRLVGASPSRCKNNAPFIALGGRGSDEPHAAYANVKLKCYRELEKARHCLANWRVGRSQE